MRTTAHRLTALALGAGLGLAVLPGVTAHRLPLPTPGTAKQVAALVAASPRITSLPTNPYPSLSEVADDRPNVYYPMPYPDCPTVTSCVYGNRHARKEIVLFGDSHAWMWLPALMPVARKDGYRVALVYLTDCPAASVTYWDPSTHAYASSCTSERAEEITKIKALDPSVVLLASMTAGRYSAPNVYFTFDQWRDGLERTIKDFRSSTTKVGVIGDMPTFNSELPQCLAAYPTDVQHCGVALPDPTRKNRGLQAAELAAAKRTGTLYVNTLPWMCTKTWCSPVIGNMIPDLNQWHIDATFSAYLSGMLGTALAPLL